MADVNFKRLREVITSAFDPSALEMTLADPPLNKDLDDLIGPGPFKVVVYKLLKLAGEEGWLQVLLEALSQRQNKALQTEIASALQALAEGASPVPPPDSALEALGGRRARSFAELARWALPPLAGFAVASCLFAGYWWLERHNAQLIIKPLDQETNTLGPLSIKYAARNQERREIRGDLPEYIVPLSDVDPGTQISVQPDPQGPAETAGMRLELKRIFYQDPRTIYLYLKKLPLSQCSENHRG